MRTRLFIGLLRKKSGAAGSLARIRRVSWLMLKTRGDPASSIGLRYVADILIRAAVSNFGGEAATNHATDSEESERDSQTS